MRTIHIMSGIPASGKTTYIAEKAQWGDIVLHRDEFRDYIRSAKESSEYFPVSADEEWKLWLGHINSHLIVAPKIDLWIDQTTNGVGAFEKLYKDLFITPHDQIIIHILETPFPQCIARNHLREGRARVPDETMISMQEGFDKRMITAAGIRTKRDRRITIRRVKGGESVDE